MTAPIKIDKVKRNLREAVVTFTAGNYSTAAVIAQIAQAQAAVLIAEELRTANMIAWNAPDSESSPRPEIAQAINERLEQ